MNESFNNGLNAIIWQIFEEINIKPENSQWYSQVIGLIYQINIEIQSLNITGSIVYPKLDNKYFL
jgi:hypothetical protein